MALSDLIEQIRLWPLKRKLAFVFVILLSFGMMWGITVWSEREDFQVLYSNIGQEDAGQVVGKLKEMKIPFKAEGNVIYVPSNKVYELRLELAAQGIPQGGGVGYEIFDKNQIGVTEFVQRLNYRRALQGELSRTIKQLAAVDQCRVHIAIPERTIFTEKKDNPTASVVVKLKPGRVLNQGQIGGIIHLVSSSIEGMSPNDVTVIDSMGTLLSKPSDGSSMVVDAKQLEYQKALEKDYENKLQSMLEGIVGRGKAIVRVATKVDLTQIEKTEEKYDPDSTAVRSEQRTQERSTGGTTGGIPGVLSNQPGQQPAQASGTAASSQKQSEHINYEISRSVSKIIQPRGEVKNISVAVLVDGTYKKEKGKDATYIPRTDAELKKYDEIIRAAIGFDKDRGDQVSVQNVPFETAITEELPPVKADYTKVISSVLKYLVPLIAVVLLIFFAIKPIIEVLKMPVKTVPPQLRGGELPQSATMMSHEPHAPEEVVKEQVMDVVKKDPRRSAMVLKEWMSE